MPRPTHVHSTTGALVATVAVLLGGVGVVSAQGGPVRPPAPSTSAPTAAGPAPEPTTSTAAPAPTTTTTTTAPAPPTTASPPPAPPTTRAPARRAPTPTTTPPAPAPARPADGAAYPMQLVRETIPARWLAAVPVSVHVIAGTTSWSNWSGLIEIGDWHLYSSEARARSTLAHEWGHQVAWHYGSDAYNGAPPTGFPYAGPTPEEQWADCVAQALTGTSYPSRGLGACPTAALGFTQQYLAAGPGTRLR